MLDLERVALERFTLGGKHAANTAHRRVEATIGNGLVHGRDLHRRHAASPQQHGREGWPVDIHPQPADGLDHVWHPHFQADLGSGQVVGIGQPLVQVDRAVRAAVIVLWAPDLAVAPFDRKRLILHPAGQGVLARLLQRGQVDSRLDQRADRPRGIDGAVEAGETCLAAADQGLYLTGFRVGHDHRRFDLVRPFAPGQALERLAHRGFGLHLQDRVEAGKDTQAFLGQVFIAVVLAQLPLDQVEEGRERAVGQAATFGHAQRHLLRCIDLLLAGHALFGHQVEHQVAAGQGTFRVTPRVVVGRALDHAHQQGDLVQLQLRQRLAEEELAGQAEAVHGTLAVLPDKDLVEVGLENFALVVMQFKQHRHHRLGHFAAEAALAAEVEVLHQLLGQGTATLAHRAG